MNTLIFFLTAIFLPGSFEISNEIHIGALIESWDDIQELTLNFAVKRINSDVSRATKPRLVPIIRRHKQYDSFRATKRVCNLIERGVTIFFGPPSPSIANHIQSISSVLQIPHLEARWDYDLNTRRIDYRSTSINVHPNPSFLSQAFADAILFYKWTIFVLIYEDNESLMRVQNIFQLLDPQKVEIILRELPKTQNLKPFLKEIQATGINQFVVDCKYETIYQVLKQAQIIGLMLKSHSFFLTSLDTHMVSMEDFKHSGANIYAYRLINFEKSENSRTLETLNKIVLGRLVGTHKSKTIVSFIRTEAALLFDSIYLLVNAIDSLNLSSSINPNLIHCKKKIAWREGRTLIRQMKKSKTVGVTGVIKFDKNGLRSDFTLDLTKLEKDGMKKIGSWNKDSGLNSTEMWRTSRVIKSRAYVVVSVLGEPFLSIVRLDENNVHAIGNNRFEGYTVDFLTELSRIIQGFEYEITISSNNMYGSNHNGTWDGAIGDVVSGRADFAVGDITVTRERESAGKFTIPFMSGWRAIVYQDPPPPEPSFFSALEPFTSNLYIVLIVAGIVVALALYIISRVSPKEVHNNKNEPLNYNALNSPWFVLSSSMSEGEDILPSAPSTRILASAWWFFVFFYFQYFTANLAAFITVQKLQVPISSLEDLAYQSKIKYGTLKGGTSESFFRDSNSTMLRRMHAFIKKTNGFFRSPEEGIDRVVKQSGKFAAVMDSNHLDYFTTIHCGLYQLGDFITHINYAVFTPKDTIFNEIISEAILELQEEGILRNLRNKWWFEKRLNSACKGGFSRKSRGIKIDTVFFKNIKGVFLILASGYLLSIVILCCEIVWYQTRKSGRRLKCNYASFKESFKILKEEIRKRWS